MNPYSKTLHWSQHTPNQRRGHAKSAPMRAISWVQDTGSFKNFPPTELDCLEIMCPHRVIKILPLNWRDRSLWITGVCTLLKRSEELSLQDEAKLNERSLLFSDETMSLYSTTEEILPSLQPSSPQKQRRRALTVTASLPLPYKNS